MNTPREPGRSRALMLPMLLGSVVFMFFMLFLILITGGFFLYLLLVISAIVPVGMLHYMVWGRSFEEQTAGEREESELLARAKQNLDRPETPEHRIWTPRS